MNPTNVLQAARLIAAVEIESLRFVNADFSCQASAAAGGDVRIDYDQKAWPVSNKEKPRFAVMAECEVRIFRSDIPEPIVCVKALYELTYRLSTMIEPPPTPGELKAFAETNGIYHAWTYFREFVQSSMARMSLPPLTIPLLRVERPKAPQPAAAVAQKALTGTTTTPDASNPDAKQ